MNSALRYDIGDMATEKENEHIIHKAEGSMFTWCEICREEEICCECKDTEPKKSMCIYCETSGRRI